MAEPLTFQIAGVTGTLQSACEPFLGHAARHLLPLRAPVGPAAPVVEAILNWHDTPPPRDRHEVDPSLSRMERLDRDLYVEGGRVYWCRIDDFRDLYLRAEWDGERLRVVGDYYFHLSRNRLRDWIKRTVARAGGTDHRKRFSTLLYYMVYYPAFWLCETLHATHPIHAAGVVSGSGALVLAGPSGVGKSTLAIALAAQGGQLLSETFLLHRGARVAAVREPILLDTWSREWLGEAIRRLEPLRRGFVFERDGYHWLTNLATEAQTASIVLPRRAPTTYVREISAADAHRQISAGNQIVKDLRRYWAFAAAMEPLAPRGLMECRERALAELTSAAKCFELGLSPDLGRGEVVQLLLGLLEPKSTATRIRA